MAEGLYVLRCGRAGDAPAFPNVHALTNCRLVDIDDALSFHHCAEQCKCKLLSLDQCCVAIGSYVRSLQRLVLEAKISDHDLAHNLLGDAPILCVVHRLLDLCHILDATVEGQDLSYSVRDGCHLFSFAPHILLLFFDVLQSSLALASDAAYKANGDFVFFRDVAARSFFYELCVADSYKIFYIEFVEFATTILVTKSALFWLVAVLFFRKNFLM